jgi:putative effector of murein hydrolase LrgA (UPF0299 family)
LEYRPLPEGFEPDLEYVVRTWVDNLSSRLLVPAGIGVVKYQDLSELM